MQGVLSRFLCRKTRPLISEISGFRDQNMFGGLRTRFLFIVLATYVCCSAQLGKRLMFSPLTMVYPGFVDTGEANISAPLWSVSSNKCADVMRIMC